MTTLKFTQDWVNHVTSEGASDFTISSADIGNLPSAEEVSSVLQKAMGVGAVREMIRRKWFSPSSFDNRIKALQEFLFSHQPELATSAMFRRQIRQRNIAEDVATLAWLCRVTDKASATTTAQFDLNNLNNKTIAHLVQLSSNDHGPREAIDYLETLGITVIIESSLPGMSSDGASFIISDFRPVIGLTLRFDRLDNFWFTLLHELAHIILHVGNDPKKVFIDSTENENSIEESEEELEANAFAKDSFIPRDAWLRSEAFRLGKEPAIISLAKEFNVHPAVVAGRLRFERNKYQSSHHLLGAGEVRNALLAE